MTIPRFSQILLIVPVLTAALSGVATAQPIFSEDFESGQGAWTVDNGVWQVGVPTAGPSTAISGTSVAGTTLAGTHPTYTDSRLISPTLVLPAANPGEETHLRFMQWFSYSTCDYGYVQISTFDPGTSLWSAWATIGNHMENDSSWSLYDVDLTSFSGQAIRIAFYHTANWSCGQAGGTSWGWYIDDVEVIQQAPAFTGDFESGWAGWSADRGVWQIGAPTTGPSTAISGTSVAGTALAGTHPTYTDSRLISPTLVLPAANPGEETHLRFMQWFSYSTCDYGYVQISTFDPGTSLWSAWATIGNHMENDSSWSLYDVDLTSFSGQAIRIAFYHTANWSCGQAGGTSWGWYIDDVEVIQQAPAFTGDFESGWAGWGADRGVWQIGAPTTGPSTAISGTSVAGTALAGTHPTYTDSRLISPTLVLPAANPGEETHLRFMQWFSYSTCDYGYVQISTFDPGTSLWSAWATIGNHMENDSSWSLYDVDLTSFSGQAIRIAFYHTANWSCGQAGGTSWGWYIDDVEVIQQAPAFTGDFESGWAGWGADRGVWQIGAPTTGPSTAISGTSVAGTALAGTHPTYTDSRLISPTLVLPAANPGEETHLRFMQWFSYSTCDYGYVQISTFDPGTSLWSAWATIGNHMENDSSWSLYDVDLTSFSGQAIRIAFYHTANWSCGQAGGTSWGWYIDDVEVIQQAPAFTGDFESGWAGWSADRGVWQIGAPTTGPSTAISGTSVAGTALAGTHPTYTDSRLISPSATLLVASSGNGIHMRFRHWFSYSTCDNGRVQLSSYDQMTGAWSTWSDISSVYQGTSAGWDLVDLDLTSFAGQTIRVAFYHTANWSCGLPGGTSWGWYIDDVTLDSGFTAGPLTWQAVPLAGFECQSAGTLVPSGTPDCEGWESFSGSQIIMPDGIFQIGPCTLPLDGSAQWCEVSPYATGPAVPSVGGPGQGIWPFNSGTVSEMRLSTTVPYSVAGRVSLRVDWCWLSGEQPGSSDHNDFAQILIIGPANEIVQLLYVDTFTAIPYGQNMCASGISGLTYPNGSINPQTATVQIPSSLMNEAVTISVVAANQGDNGFDSVLHVDNFQWGVGHALASLSVNGVNSAIVSPTSSANLELRGPAGWPFLWLFNTSPGPTLVSGFYVPIAIDAGLIDIGQFLPFPPGGVLSFMLPYVPPLDLVTLHSVGVFFDGSVPGGFALTNPISFTFSGTGALP